MRKNSSSIIERTDTLIDSTKISSNKAESLSTKLLERSGYIKDFGSGLYGLTNLGQETRKRLENIVRYYHKENGCYEVSIPSLQYSKDWEMSGRWKKFEDEMFTFKNRDSSKMCLAPTHEEGVVRMFKSTVRSYRDLPLTVFQIKEKHRDDKARDGLLRGKEFVMKDAYSMHANEESMNRRYEEMKDIYNKIFNHIGLEVVKVDADVGVMGGENSMEFVAPSRNGDDNLIFCDNCNSGLTEENHNFSSFSTGDICPFCDNAELKKQNGVEVGHIFALGQRYSAKMGFSFDKSKDKREDVYMASYGIGITRIIQTLIDQNGDEDSCSWEINNGLTLSPFDLCIIRDNNISDDTIESVRDEIDRTGLRCLEYAGQRTIGEQFSESDLIGIPVKIILGNHWSSEEELEIETDDDTIYCSLGNIETHIGDLF